MSSSKNSSIPLIIALVILAVTGWYGFSKFTELSTVNNQLTEADTILFDLEQDSADLLQDYQDAKKEYIESVSANEEKIASVLPGTEDLTSLTRAFDDFAFENHYTNNPFFISQLSYGEVVEMEGYRVLPISMTISASDSNFEKFLEYVETSGSLDNGIRLMSIDSFSLQIQEDTDDLTVQLSISAYLQDV